MSLEISRLCQGIAPSVTLKINAMAAQLREKGQDIISLGAGEPDFDTPAFIRDAAKAALDAGETRYTAASGTPALRRSVCDFLRREKGLTYRPDQVLICTGAKQALLNAFVAMLNPGDEVILPAPCWVSYPEMIAMAGGKAVWVEATEAEGFVPPIERIRAAVTERTKAILLNSPNNPTGAVWTREQLLAVGQLAVEKDIYLISDEIYDQLVYDGAEAVSVASLSPAIYARTLMVNGWSKAYAMTGWRLGYLVCPEYVMERLLLLSAGIIAAVPTFVQAAGVAALRQDVSAMRETYRRRRDYVTGRLRGMGLQFPQPQGAFYVFADIRKFGMSSDEFCTRLIAEGKLATVPGSCFGTDGYLRISYCYSDSALKTGLDRLERFLAGLQPQPCAP